MVNRSTGATINIKGNSKILKALFNQVMVPVHDLLYGNSLLAGTNGNGYAVLIGATDKEDLFAFHPEVTRVDIGGDIDAC